MVRECRTCGGEFETHGRFQIYCRPGCKPQYAPALLSEEEYREMLLSAVQGLCGNDPEKMEKLIRHFESPSRSNPPPTLGEVIGPYKRKLAAVADEIW